MPKIQLYLISVGLKFSCSKLILITGPSWTFAIKLVFLLQICSDELSMTDMDNNKSQNTIKKL